jgi:hypothetical protein
MLMVVPLAASAQWRGPAQGARHAMGPGGGEPALMRQRMRLARTLGLAEALELDEAQALKLGQLLGQFDERQLAAQRQLDAAFGVLRQAASAEKASPADVERAIKDAFDARAQIQALERERATAVTRDLPPQKRARAVLFLERFQTRFGGDGGPGGPMGAGPGAGPGGRGMGNARACSCQANDHEH